MLDKSSPQSAPMLLPQTKAVRALHASIRHPEVPQSVFVHNSRRLIRLLLEQALDLLPYDEVEVPTPSGGLYQGFRLGVPLCGVSILRAGDSMEAELRAIVPEIPIGKILIQRDQTTKEPNFYFAKLPTDIADRHVLLLDPMLATGGTAVEAVTRLREYGVEPGRIILVTLLSVSNGLNRIHNTYPEVRVVTSSIEDELNEHAYMLPGIGDFGDRYFGTYVPRPAISIS